MNIQQIYQLFIESTGICIDSRKCQAGDLFVALKGDNFDGNSFVDKAFEAGCSYALVDDPSLANREKCIFVEDCLCCLQRLATYHRDALAIPILAITGSNGKTSTKELVAAVLSTKYTLAYTQGNLNNHIGVPLTLLSMDASHELAIVEMGANHPGEIEALCAIARPNGGLITNIGRAHLEGFGSLEGVKKAKGEMYQYLKKNNGFVFVNANDALLMEMSVGMRSVCYGSSKECLVSATMLDSREGVSVQWAVAGETRETHVRLEGDYNFDNILAACCVGSYWGIEVDAIHQALESYVPSLMRSQKIVTAHNEITLDAYNANPSSMERAIENHARKDELVFILGDMKELGEYAKKEHQKVLKQLESCSEAEILLLGEHFMELASNYPVGEFHFFDDIDLLLNYLRTKMFKGKRILIKGSRGMALEKILKEQLI